MMYRFAAAAIALTASAAQATHDDLRSVAAMQYHNRVLVVFTPSLSDPRVTEERRAMSAIGLDAAERDLILVQVSGKAVIGAHDNADKLRWRFKVAPAQFRVLLMGKDGTVALASSSPLDGRRILATIDAMPMRKAEMQAAREGRMPAKSR